VTDDLVNIIQKELWGALIISFFSNIELRIWQIIHQEGFWINKMSKFLLFFKIVLVRSLFFQTFCEKSFRNFIIIIYFYPQISKLSWLWFLELLRFLCMPLFIEFVFPEKTVIADCLVFVFTVNVLEWVSI